MCPACPGPFRSILPPLSPADPHYLLPWVHSRVSLRRGLPHQFSLVPTEDLLHIKLATLHNLSLPFISGFSFITDIAQVTGDNSFSKRQSRDGLAEEKGTGACPAINSASRVLSILPTVNCGSYFMIWSGTGLFLNLGCSSRTGCTVKHWMSISSKLRI